MILLYKYGPNKPVQVYQETDILTACEKNFYQSLRIAVGNEYLVSFKTRLADLITAVNRPNRNKAFWRIACKHIDFTLIDPVTLDVMLCIELDDKSHSRADRRARDHFVDFALGNADIKLLRITAKAFYNPKDIRQKIDTILNIGSDSLNKPRLQQQATQH